MVEVSSVALREGKKNFAVIHTKGDGVPSPEIGYSIYFYCNYRCGVSEQFTQQFSSSVWSRFLLTAANSPSGQRRNYTIRLQQ